MATQGKNLSDYKAEELASCKPEKIGIVVAEWNRHITQALLDGAYSTLKANGFNESLIELIWVPGSFELALGASWLLEYKKVSGVIVLGCVIQGETRHFDFVCQGVTQSIADLNIKWNKPVIYGLLTDNTEQQSIDRSGGKHGNKGIECAVSLIKMLALRQSLEA